MYKKSHVFPALLWVLIFTVIGLAAAQNNSPPEKLIPLTLQLQWSPQAQFAGYLVAKEKGFYKQEGLDVTIRPGGADISTHTALIEDKADIGIDWLPKVLATPETRGKLINIAQIFQRSGTLEIAWKDSGIKKLSDLRGKKVATWGLGDELELYAALENAGINPYNKEEITIVKEHESIIPFLKREIDAMEAMDYNEYYQVLEAINPQTGRPYQQSDLVVFDFDDPEINTAMLQDGIYVRKDWIAKPENEKIAIKFLKATFRGWLYCFNHFEECKKIVLRNSVIKDEPLVDWQLKKINELIWPSPKGLGIMEENAFLRTIKIMIRHKMIDEEAAKNVYRTDLAQKALQDLGLGAE